MQLIEVGVLILMKYGTSQSINPYYYLLLSISTYLAFRPNFCLIAIAYMIDFTFKFDWIFNMVHHYLSILTITVVNFYHNLSCIWDQTSV